MSLPPLVDFPRCNVSPHELAAAVGSHVGPPQVVADAEALSRGVAPSPDPVEHLDGMAWLTWSLSGIPLFTGPTIPTLGAATEQARRIMAALAMSRTYGNFTHAAEHLGCSRRIVRDLIMRADLYPWPGSPRDG